MASPEFTDIAPIFPVANLRAALAHYQALGFRVAPYADGDDYGFAERGKVSIHLTYRPTSYYPDNGIAVAYLGVADADELYAEWSREGVGGRTEAPGDMEWGMREGVHTDPDGNVIRFGSPLATSQG
jgi:catechol 2,3-dioxygenase-like lactoylglutathione lyase family enzyme